jgi:hypothetical protein
MTQSADNINLTTSRHMSTTVIRYNDVIHNAADMQTQSPERNDRQTPESQHNSIVINAIIHDEKNSQTLDVSKQLCRMQSRSRDIVIKNGSREEASWYSVVAEILYIMEQTIFSVLSNQEPVNMVTNAQHNFQRGLLSTMKNGI